MGDHGGRWVGMEERVVTFIVLRGEGPPFSWEKKRIKRGHPWKRLVRENSSGGSKEGLGVSESGAHAGRKRILTSRTPEKKVRKSPP